jgi:hypothetical protein
MVELWEGRGAQMQPRLIWFYRPSFQSSVARCLKFQLKNCKGAGEKKMARRICGQILAQCY